MKYLILLLLLMPVSIHASEITGQNVFKAVNEVRKEQGLSKLNPNPKLVKAAQDKANDMAFKGYFAHKYEGKNLRYFIQKAGYRYSIAGENLGVEFTSAEDLLESWMNSKTHKGVILNPKYKDTGIGIARGKLDGKDVVFVVQMFGRGK